MEPAAISHLSCFPMTTAEKSNNRGVEVHYTTSRSCPAKKVTRVRSAAETKAVAARSEFCFFKSLACLEKTIVCKAMPSGNLL
jgi:hypothetical protein